MSNKVKFYKTQLDANIKIDKNDNFRKAISAYIDNTEFAPSLREELELKQPDLLYGVSVLVSEGVNKNSDTFLREVLGETYKSPRNKFVDYEHDETGSNKRGNNPGRYHIVGHIYDSVLASQETGEHIADDQIVFGSDGKLFSSDSKYRDEKLDIIVAWAMYKFEFPELAAEILEKTETVENFGVSMEVLFSDYKFRVGKEPGPGEPFDFDGNLIAGVTEYRKGDLIAEMFQEGWNQGKHRSYKGKPVYRIMGGQIFFSGMAITKNRANHRSWNIALGSAREHVEENKIKDVALENLLQAIAAKSETFNLDTCEIVNGEPSCACINVAVSDTIEVVEKEINDLIEAMAKLTNMDYIDMDTILTKLYDIETSIGEIRKKIEE